MNKKIFLVKFDTNYFVRHLNIYFSHRFSDFLQFMYDTCIKLFESVTRDSLASSSQGKVDSYKKRGFIVLHLACDAFILGLCTKYMLWLHFEQFLS